MYELYELYCAQRYRSTLYDLYSIVSTTRVKSQIVLTYLDFPPFFFTGIFRTSQIFTNYNWK